MKLSNLLKSARALRSVVLAAVALVSSSVGQAANFFDNNILGVDLGTASGSNQPGRYTWAIFALSGGVTITDPAPYNALDYDVLGNIGVAFGGNLRMDRSNAFGTAYIRNGGSSTLLNSATITGGTLANQDAILNPASASAFSAASTAAGLARSTAGLGVSGSVGPGILANDTTSIALANSAGAITGGAANTNYVINLTNLILSGASAVLTLNGTSTTNYIINVERYMTLSQGASIQLSGGLLPQNVLFNVRNSYAYDVTLSGGSEVNGIILATNRNVKLTGDSHVEGEVIARAVSLSGRSSVHNPLVSP